MIPAITDFRAKGTIMGLAGLTAVFGMGTGVAPPVWSPEMYPAGGQARRAPRINRCSHASGTISAAAIALSSHQHQCGPRRPRDHFPRRLGVLSDHRFDRSLA